MALDTPKDKVYFIIGLIIAGAILFFRFTETGDVLTRGFFNWMWNISPWLVGIFILSSFLLVVYGIIYFIKMGLKKGDSGKKLHIFIVPAIWIIVLGILFFIILASLIRAITSLG